MKKICFALLSAVFVLGMSSCSEDFKVAAPYKNITVVYGLMNVGDTAHYIRIQKAFLDENKSAIEMATVADSSYFANITASLKELNGNTVIQTINLSRVDLRNEGFPKDSGAFFNAPSYAYKTTYPLNPANRYRLVIFNNATGEVDSAETSVIPNSNSQFNINKFDQATFNISFPKQLQGQQFSISIRSPANAVYYEGIIRFHWVDSNMLTHVNRTDSVDWTFATGVNPGGAANGGVVLSVLETSFYPFLRDAIGPAPENTVRFLDSSNVFVWAGSSELYTYLQVNQAQGGGITADQIKPNYTNIKGANTLGLFASRALRAANNVPFDQVTIDSLKANSLTQGLRIQGVSRH